MANRIILDAFPYVTPPDSEGWAGNILFRGPVNWNSFSNLVNPDPVYGHPITSSSSGLDPLLSNHHVSCWFGIQGVNSEFIESLGEDLVCSVSFDLVKIYKIRQKSVNNTVSPVEVCYNESEIEEIEHITLSFDVTDSNSYLAPYNDYCGAFFDFHYKTWKELELIPCLASFTSTSKSFISYNTAFKNYSATWNKKSSCQDLRSSNNTQEVLLTFNGSYAPVKLSIDIPDPQVSYQHREVLNLSSTPLNLSVLVQNMYFNSFDRVTARFLDNSVRGSGIINIYGKVQFYRNEFVGLVGELVNALDNSQIQEYLLFQLLFDDYCCKSPSGWSDNFSGMPPISTGLGSLSYDDLLNDYDYTVFEITRIEFKGFEALVNHCCDDSDCAETPDDIQIDEGKIGGIDMTDISCICDNLAQLNTRVNSFVSLFEELLAEQKGIGLTFGDSKTLLGSLVNFTGMSNELLGSLVTIVNGKEMSPQITVEAPDVTVNPQITVEPCSPVVTNPVNNITVTPSTAEINVEPCSPIVQVTNPVNNITVTPSTAEITVEAPDVTVNPQITVEPCSPVVTNPVNNITVTPSTAAINVEPCQPIINNVLPESINVEDSALSEKLEELFKTGDDTITDVFNDTLKTTYNGVDGEEITEGLTDVIRKKQDTNVVECIVEPVNMAYQGYGKYVDKDMLSQ